MEYDIVSVGLTEEGYYAMDDGQLLVRTERIDTQTNELFRNCVTQEDVRKAYEAFWMLDNRWKHGQAKVLGVIPVNREREINMREFQNHGMVERGGR